MENHVSKGDSVVSQTLCLLKFIKSSWGLHEINQPIPNPDHPGFLTKLVRYYERWSSTHLKDIQPKKTVTDKSKIIWFDQRRFPSLTFSFHQWLSRFCLFSEKDSKNYIRSYPWFTIFAFLWFYILKFWSVKKKPSGKWG